MKTNVSHIRNPDPTFEIKTDPDPTVEKKKLIRVHFQHRLRVFFNIENAFRNMVCQFENRVRIQPLKITDPTRLKFPDPDQKQRHISLFFPPGFGLKKSYKNKFKMFQTIISFINLIPSVVFKLAYVHYIKLKSRYNL